MAASPNFPGATTGPFSWRFQKLYPGPNDRGPKEMILQGWSAPFGRPRNGSLLNAGVAIRRQVTYYPGNNVPATIHSFGTEPKEWHLHGRWMDFAIGAPGLAQKARSDWRDFVSDQQIVRATWGPILSYQIFIHDFDAHFESPGELAWELKADVIVDENAQTSARQLPSPTPLDYAASLRQEIGNLYPFSAPSYFNLRGFLSSITDTMDSLVAAINAPFTFLYNTCSALSDFQTALSSDISSMLGGISMMRTGLLELRDSTDNFVSGAFLLNSPDETVASSLQSPGALFPADFTQKLVTDKASSDAANANMAALLADLRAQLATVQRGSAQTAYVARTGDTWESIALLKMGAIDGADAIRSMNGVRYGSQPTPGKRYMIPTSTGQGTRG